MNLNQPPTDAATPRPYLHIVMETYGDNRKLRGELPVVRCEDLDIIICSLGASKEKCMEKAKAIVYALNLLAAHEAGIVALKGLIDAYKIARKQWIGRNMNNAGEKRAYEIEQAANIIAEKALANLAKFKKELQ